MASQQALIEELAFVMEELHGVYERRDANVRETNDLMIREHNLKEKIQRINVDLISLPRRVN